MYPKPVAQASKIFLKGLHWSGYQSTGAEHRASQILWCMPCSTYHFIRIVCLFVYSTCGV